MCKPPAWAVRSRTTEIFSCGGSGRIEKAGALERPAEPHIGGPKNQLPETGADVRFPTLSIVAVRDESGRSANWRRRADPSIGPVKIMEKGAGATVMGPF